MLVPALGASTSAALLSVRDVRWAVLLHLLAAGCRGCAPLPRRSTAVWARGGRSVARPSARGCRCPGPRRVCGAACLARTSGRPWRHGAAAASSSMTRCSPYSTALGRPLRALRSWAASSSAALLGSFIAPNKVEASPRCDMCTRPLLGPHSWMWTLVGPKTVVLPTSTAAATLGFGCLASLAWKWSSRSRSCVHKRALAGLWWFR